MTIPRARIQTLPDAPGVYFFKRGSTVLYIGKATSLRDRVRSYFGSDLLETRGPRLVQMMEQATTIAYEQTDSVLEALILEAALIRKHEPHYNAIEKDNKSFQYVVITDEEYPRVYTVRGRELLIGGDVPFQHTFGPFVSGSQLRAALSIIRKIFPFRGKRDAPLAREKRRSRVYQELGLAPDVSTVSAEQYARTIRHVVLLFEGKKKQLVRALEREMRAHARARAFERAEEVKRQIFALQHINDVALLTSEQKHTEGLARIEAYDVAHTSEKNRIGVMTVVSGTEPQRSAYRVFNIKSARAGDTHALAEVLERRFGHMEWPLPQLLVVDGSTAQIRAAEGVLKAFGYQIPVVAVTKDARHRPQRIQGKKENITGNETAILLANAEAHRFSLAKHRTKRSRF